MLVYLSIQIDKAESAGDTLSEFLDDTETVLETCPYTDQQGKETAPLLIALIGC